MKGHKALYIIAGANGCGKSTLARNLLPLERLQFLNADDIARSICPEHMESVIIDAGKQFIRQLNVLLLKEESFAIETTLAGKNHLKTIKRAKQLGFFVNLIYLYIDNPIMCQNRIKIRVLNGGHFVPNKDVIRRFHRSLQNFWNLYKNAVDEWSLIYNGQSLYTVVAAQQANTLEILEQDMYEQFQGSIK